MNTLFTNTLFTNTLLTSENNCVIKLLDKYFGLKYENIRQFLTNVNTLDYDLQCEITNLLEKYYDVHMNYLETFERQVLEFVLNELDNLDGDYKPTEEDILQLLKDQQYEYETDISTDEEMNQNN